MFRIFGTYTLAFSHTLAKKLSDKFTNFLFSHTQVNE